MGRCFIKPEPLSTHYVQWSSVVDSVVAYGTREELLAYEREERGRQGVEEAEKALDRADDHGTSDRTFRFGGWNDEELLVMEGGGPGYLRRLDLERYAVLMCTNTEKATAEAHSLIRPREIED